MSWLDDEFWRQGAFLADAHRKTVLFAKGGNLEKVSEITVSDGPVFYLKDFFTNSYFKYHPQDILELPMAEAEAWAQALESKCSFISTGNEDETYTQDFKHLKNCFSFSLEKVVLVSREEFKASDGNLAQKKIFKGAFAFGVGIPYGFWHKDYGIIGSTPEILFTLAGKNFKTAALAGTGKKGQEEDLLDSEKDWQEHQLVIKDIEEKLNLLKLAPQISQTGIASFKDMIHLKTEIEAKVESNVSINDLAKTLSPTAALGGYPQIQSLRFLNNSIYQLKHPERYFGSAFGVVSRNVSQFVVMIRNVQWRQKNFFIESGGGVLPESELNRELEEINLKRNIIKKNYL